ncbi:ABC transporter substrate-binding protein [Bordetella sp. N]|uniref:ABC transporter substrate-binding protein n=1 Tax=Bordetella sp. N TaxID=1746199 RepID=UPI001E434C14|nr:ABC transporter substrate-binding protein [Bordetella sp. N]
MGAWLGMAAGGMLAGRCAPVLAATPATSATPALRLACTDWAAAESLAWLGHPPIAVPELAVYRRWLSDPPLPDATVDLGSRTEPNFEVLARLAPDRIFASSWQATSLPFFERIAPTQLVRIFNANSQPYPNIRELLMHLAEVCDARDVARERLRGFDADIEALRAGLGRRVGSSVYVVVLHESGTQAYVYGTGSWVQSIIEALGLRNAWDRHTNFYGNILTGIANLAEQPDACILYMDQGPRTQRAEAVLKGSTLWNRLPAVRAGRVTAIDSFFALGGLPSALRCARLVAGAVARLPEAVS